MSVRVGSGLASQRGRSFTAVDVPIGMYVRAGAVSVLMLWQFHSCRWLRATGRTSRTLRLIRPPPRQEDINVGYVYSTAFLEGWSPSPGAVKVATKDTEAVTVPRQMNISLESVLLSMSTSEGFDSEYSDEGDSAIFQVTITNTGNTVLSSVILTNWIVGSEAFDCDQDFSAADSEFLPSSHLAGVPLVCDVTVPLTASYVDAGGFNSTSEVGFKGFMS